MASPSIANFSFKIFWDAASLPSYEELPPSLRIDCLSEFVDAKPKKLILQAYQRLTEKVRG
jgi:hypothetical protein